MFAFNPLRRNPDFSPASLKQPAPPLVDSNKVLQRALKKISAEAKNAMVLRCDELPYLQGTEETIELAFTRLLQLILEKKDAVIKVYLHISSTLSTIKELKASDRPDLHRFLVRFHTNLVPDKDWLKKAKESINGIASVLSIYDGNIAIQQLKSSGCVFYISLPGKL